MNINEIETLVEEEVRTEIFYPFIDKSTDGVRIVEVGTFVGGNLCRVANHIKGIGKQIDLIGVDNFHFVNISNQAINSVGLKFGEYDVRQESFYQTLVNNINLNELQNFIRLIDGDSIDVAKTFEDESIDLLFLDGSHSYPYVGNELQAWLPKVKKGGIISGHDWPCDGIQLAVKEQLPNHQIHITSTNGAYWTIHYV
jgi:cephalosporin hydroxylase